nr:AfsR/SARP family transcriptional regulator [Saccharothrix ecbatanensis]
MDAGILGPLQLRVGSISGVPSAPKLRSVLGTLLVHEGQTVPTFALMSELWDDKPPVSGLTTLQTYILNLRKLFASTMKLSLTEISREVLVTRAGGYVFNIGPSNLDLNRYNTYLAAAQAALAGGDDRTAVKSLGEALRVWRGPALVDVKGGRVLESKRRQLEESRLVAVEYMVDAQLRLGHHREVLPELVMLTTENPLHEGLHAQYMRALHYSGRRAQALMVYQMLRDKLVFELGLEPSPQVQRLHLGILSSSGDLDSDISI